MKGITKKLFLGFINSISINQSMNQLFFIYTLQFDWPMDS